MRSLLRSLLLPLLLVGPVAWGQSLDYTWLVTHDKALTAYLTSMEATRTSLETQYATQKGIESTLWTTTAGTEAYSWLRSYAQFLRTLRALEKVREAIMLTKIPVWTLLPQIGFVAPVQYTDPDTGKPLVRDREIASLSPVPPAYQAHWLASDYYEDDEMFGASDINGQGRSRIQVKYPHSLSDVQLTFSPSPFLSDYAFDESQAIDDLKANFFEALMDASARLAGFGITFNPQILADGSALVEGRMTPAQLKLQASLYEQQAMGLINKIHTLYLDHGVPFSEADRMVKGDLTFWDGFGSRMNVLGNARAMFAMNLMNEVHESIGRLEAYQRRMKVAETEEQLYHLGQKKNPDGTWSGFLEHSHDFWDMVDRVSGMQNGGRAVRLQAEGLSARFSRFQFDEAEGLRNVLMGDQRMRIALEGIASEDQMKREMAAVNQQDAGYDLLTLYFKKRDEIAQQINNSGWGGLRSFFDQRDQ